jgi:hypothetical protein
MVVRRMDETEDERTTLLRVTIPKRLLEEIRETKRLCREHGFVFDIRPDVKTSIEKAIEEARRAVAAEGEPGKPE